MGVEGHHPGGGICSRAYGGRFYRRRPYFVAVHRDEARPGGTEWDWLHGWLHAACCMMYYSYCMLLCSAHNTQHNT